MTERICDECGKGFTVKPHSRPDQRFCRDSCRKANWTKARYRTDPVYAEKMRAKNRRQYANLTGLTYAKRMMQMRRVNGLRRKSLRAARLEAAKGE